MPRIVLAGAIAAAALTLAACSGGNEDAANATAEGATAEGGRPHAEELALAQAGAAARGATAYVTLEPCAKRSTGAMSCADRLIEAGVSRVVIAAPDPHPFASGVGIERLQAAGLRVKKEGKPNDLIDRLKADPHFAKVNLDEVLDPMAYVGRSVEQVDRFLKEVVDPLREQYGEALKGLAATEPRV